MRVSYGPMLDELQAPPTLYRIGQGLPPTVDGTAAAQRFIRLHGSNLDRAFGNSPGSIV